MSSEVCPFCGKTYKRLKSHLPHCKVAAMSKLPPTKHEVSVDQTVAAVSRTKVKGKTSMSVTTDMSSSPVSLPSSTKKKKQKLSDQIRASIVFPPQAPTTKSKKSLHALKEAAKSDLPIQETRASSDPPPSSRTKAKPEKDVAFLPSDSNPKDDPKKALSEGNISSSIKHISDSLDTKQNDRSKKNFWGYSEEEVEDLSANKSFLKAGRITLQDVKAILGRTKPTGQSSSLSLLKQIKTTDNMTPSPVPLPGHSRKDAETHSQNRDSQLVKEKTSQCKQLALMPPLKEASLLPEPSTLLSAHVSSQVMKSTPPPDLVNQRLKLGCHMIGRLAVSPAVTQFSSPLLFPLAPQTAPARAEAAEKLEVRKQNVTEIKPEGALTDRSLGEVRLRELPDWLSSKTPRHPREVMGMVQRGWQWYYRRYIDVKKGGAAGLSMLLAGYCVLSYIWSYPHIKRHRWRKYH
ncbi:uncharacterized protein KZ484_010795 [Pholidichthys leucotaenia]